MRFLRRTASNTDVHEARRRRGPCSVTCSAAVQARHRRPALHVPRLRRSRADRVHQVRCTLHIHVVTAPQRPVGCVHPRVPARHQPVQLCQLVINVLSCARDGLQRSRITSRPIWSTCAARARTTTRAPSSSLLLTASPARPPHPAVTHSPCMAAEQARQLWKLFTEFEISRGSLQDVGWCCDVLAITGADRRH